ncbi:NUDIX hydrolase [Candidatus Margulisiibacteriota bacterium]
MSEVKFVFSAGGVVFKKEASKIKVVLTVKSGGKITCLPKGHIEKGERSEDAATREVKEETGLTGNLIEKIGDIEYWFAEAGQKIHKKVAFFLFEQTGGSTKDHDFEVEEVKWYDLSEAVKTTTYKSEKDIIKKAGKLIP